MKKLLLSMAIGFCTQFIAQTNFQAFDWAFNTGGSGDKVKKMIYNSAGDLIVMGQAMDTAAFGNVVIGAPKIGSYAGTVQYIGKRTATGVYSVLYNTYMNPTTLSSIVPVDFCLDANDNIFMMGTVSTLPPNLANFGNGFTVDSNSFFVAKLNPAGTVQWVKKFRLGTNFNAFIDPLNIGCLPNGDVLFIAQSANSGPAGAYPVRFIRLSNNGNEIWQREYFFKNTAGGPLSFYASKTSHNGFFFDNTGNFYLRYTTISQNKIVINSDTVTAAGSGNAAYTFFCAFNANGFKRYYKGYKSAIGDLGVERTTGNILMSYVQNTVNPAPFNTVPVVSTLVAAYSGLVIADSSFNFIKCSQSAVANSSLFIAPASIYPLGNFKALSAIEYCKNNTIAAGTQTYSSNSNSVFSWKETDGNCVPTYFIAEPAINGNCTTPNLAIAVNGNKATVSGNWLKSSQNSITINTATLNANDKNATPTSTTISSDAFITQFDRTLQGSSTGIAESFKGLEHLITVYPNPSTGNFKIELQNADAGYIEIYNLSGQKVYNNYFEGAFTEINEPFAPGTYLIKVTLSNGKYSAKKIIIQ